jgi:hypothetical protein
MTKENMKSLSEPKMDKEELAKETQRLIAEYLDKGGTITKLAPVEVSEQAKPLKLKGKKPVKGKMK